MEIKSVKDKDWGKYKGRRVQVLRGLMYDGPITEKIGELVISGYNLRKVFGCSMNFAGELPVVKKGKKREVVK